MAVLRSGLFLAPPASLSSHSAGAIRDDSGRTSVSYCGGCLSGNAGDVSERLNPGGLIIGNGACSRGRLVVVGRAGGSRPAAGARRPRPQPNRRSGAKESQDEGGPLLNGDIRWVFGCRARLIACEWQLCASFFWFGVQRGGHLQSIPILLLTIRMDYNAEFPLLGSSTKNRTWYVKLSKFPAICSRRFYRD